MEIYLNDEEQEIFDEGYKSAKSYLPCCSYEYGTLGFTLWWKGFWYASKTNT